MKVSKRSRDIQVKFRVTERELALIAQGMEKVGTTNREAYLRKMATNGMIVVIEIGLLRKVLSELGRADNNLNQYARRANETGRIYQEDIDDLMQLYRGIRTDMQTVVQQLEGLPLLDTIQ